MDLYTELGPEKLYIESGLVSEIIVLIDLKLLRSIFTRFIFSKFKFGDKYLNFLK